MRSIKLLGVAFFAVLAFSAMAASTASAFHPLFITQSGKELLFEGHGGLALLRAGSSVVDCELTLIHGFALHLSTLAHRILLLFEGKCELFNSAIGKTPCSNEGEHIMSLLLLGELGLLSSTNHLVLILLAPASGTHVATFKCVSPLVGTVTVTGAIIGHIPEKNALGEVQINTPRSEIETVFESEGKNSAKQAITEIFLLGTQMPGPIHLTSESALEAAKEASEEVKPVLKGDGTIEITTTKE